MVVLVIFICAVALAYLSLTEDEEENLPQKCSNCANCTKNKKQDNLYPYCSRRDMFLMNIETGVIRFFGEDPNYFDISDGRELSNGVLDMLNYVHANDQLLVKKAVSSVISHDVEEIDINFRMHNNNNMRWVNCRGSVIKDKMDNHFVFIGRISQNAVKHLYNPITTLFNKAKLTMDLQNESAEGLAV